jgi:hypothetical protein
LVSRVGVPGDGLMMRFLVKVRSLENILSTYRVCIFSSDGTQPA